MRVNDEPARLGHRGGVSSRAKGFVAKTVAVLAGGVVLASAFVVSLVFFAVALAMMIIGGGYVWWKTRELRRQIRAQFDAQSRGQHAGATTNGDVIEGVVISRSQSSDDRDRIQ